jgi:hypothetical protein
MSLPTMKRSLEEDPSYSFENFKADFSLMVDNAMTYNHVGDPVYNMALDIKSRLESMLAASEAAGGGSSLPNPHLGSETPSKKRGRTPPLP